MVEVSAGFSGPWGRQWPACKETCEVRSVALEQQLWKYLNPLKGKMGDRRFFICSFCGEPYVDSQLGTASLFATVTGHMHGSLFDF